MGGWVSWRPKNGDLAHLEKLIGKTLDKLRYIVIIKIGYDIS
jgi:hypothetical protein